jgi:hypothetical protein
MNEPEQASNMFIMAKKDFYTLQLMLKDPGFADEVFGFHAQQAVEKALKTWLISVQHQHPKIHDLHTLARLLRESGQSLPERFEALLDLTAFGTVFLYQSSEPFDDNLDRAGMVDKIGDFLAFVRNRCGLPE